MNNLITGTHRLSDLLEKSQSTGRRSGQIDPVARDHLQRHVEDECSGSGQNRFFCGLDASSNKEVQYVLFFGSLPQTAIAGLVDLSENRPGISSFSSVKLLPAVRLYRKNGIIVGHSGKKITNQDVADALDEE